MAIYSRKASFQNTASGTSMTLAFSEGTALDSTYLLVAFVSYTGSSVFTSGTSWGGVEKFGDNQGSTRFEVWTKQGNSTTNDITVNLTGGGTQREILLIALKGYASESFNVASWTAKNTSVTGVSMGPLATPTVSANTIALAALTLSGTPAAFGVDWGNYTNGFVQVESRLTQQRLNVGLLPYTTSGQTPSTAVSWDPTRSRAYTGGIFILQGVSADASGDGVSPSVSITSPASGSTVSDLISITVTATDDTAVTSVVATVSSVEVGTFINTSGDTWSLDLDTLQFQDGSVTITVEARDAANNLGTDSITVTVENISAPEIPVSKLYLGIVPLNSIKLGGTTVSRAYYGTELIYGSLPTEEEPEVPATASFGPNGTHWPDFTPLRADTFVYDVEVDATWTAIGTAITNAPASGNARIRVRPGTLPVGYGANSTDTGVLQGIGSATRTTRILITPRDGFGTVVGQGTIAAGDSQGYGFVNLGGITLHGFDFSGQVVNFRNCRNSALAWSTIGLGNVVANGSSGVDGFQMVEVVAATQLDAEIDRMAVRTGSSGGNTIVNLDFLGCYFAPVYKANGSSAHCDTLQFSGTGGSITKVLFKDTAFFQSSSQVIMCERLGELTIDNTAMIGGQRAISRYPIAGGRHVMVGQNTLWGGSINAVAKDSYILGSVSSSHSFDSVTNTIVPQSVGAPVGSGSFTVDSGYAPFDSLPGGWLNTNIPLPDGTRLSTIWA
jgi:hypothetical protein